MATRALVLCLSLAALAARADNADAGTPEDAAPVAGLSATVAGERTVVAKPQAIEVVNRADLQRNDGLSLDDTLNLIPGVRFESRTPSGGQRVTIRGYGQATNFNGVGYKAYLDGIPLTDAEGNTILNDVDPSTLGKVEVIKGPASSLFGAGIGGVVLFSTLQPEPDTTRFSQEAIGGTQSLLRSNTRAERDDGNLALVANYGHQQSDGFRSNSSNDRDYALFTARYTPSSKQSLFVYAAYDHAFDHLPGEMTQQQFLARDESYTDPQYIQNGAHIAIEGARLGLSHKYSFLPSVVNTTSLFASQYDLDQPTAAGLTDNSVLSVGGRTDLSARFKLGEIGFETTFGTEIERTNAFKKSYALSKGILGGIRGDLQVGSIQSNTFLQAVAKLPAEIDVTAGASLDFVRYVIQDRLANSANPTHLNQSGARTFDPIVAPRLAVLKSLGDVSVYAQVSQGYTPPSSSAVVIAQSGLVNTGLKPERGTLLELGSKGTFLGGRLWFEASVFDLIVQDKLTPQTVTDQFGTYPITTNAGKQNDVGFELAARFALYKSEEGPLRLVQLYGSYAFSSFHYDGFKSDNNNGNTVDYSGKNVVGVPPHVINATLDVTSAWGFYLLGSFEHVSPMPIVYDNSQGAPAYGLVNAKIGYRAEPVRHLRLDLSAGSRNLFGATYYTEVFLNASNNGQGIYLNGPYNATFYGMLSLSYAL